jgi:hypothetical protein
MTPGLPYKKQIKKIMKDKTEKKTYKNKNKQ